MKYNTNSTLKLSMWLASIVAAGIFVSGCKTADAGKAEFDDAIRIKPEAQRSYEKMPVTGTIRDGRTLHGKVIEVIIAPNQNDPQKIDTTISFLAAGNPTDDSEYYELIPYSDVEPVGRMFSMPRNKYNNVNYFENYNITSEARGLREAPVRISAMPGGGSSGAGGNSDQKCDCEPLNFSIKCPTRDYSLIFVEARAVYSMFGDKPAAMINSGRTSWEGEVVSGVRFGANREWGIGLAYSTGTSVFNSANGLDATRPVMLGHLRYSLGKGPMGLLGFCARPFFYAQGGVALDKATFNLIKLNISPDSCSSCNQLIKQLSVSGQLPEADFSMPVSYGFGAGLDIPLLSWLDASADIGWRSLAIADELQIAGFTNVPSNRRVNMLRLRIGLTF